MNWVGVAGPVMLALLLVGCGNSDPGPLKGTWQVRGVVPMTVEFRPGETEALGLIEKVSYEVRGDDVIVTYESGPAKGVAMRYTMTGSDTARSELGTLRRVDERR